MSCSICRLNVNSKGAVNGIFADRFGSRGSEKIKNMITYSIPIEWSSGPCSTASYAITVMDYDAVPIIGFPWIHWIVANIPSNIRSIKENASRKGVFIEGTTSFSNDVLVKFDAIQDFRVPREASIGYGGFAPADKPHTYEVKVYALSSKLNLRIGFGYNDMIKEMKNKIIGEGAFYGIYSN